MRKTGKFFHLGTKRYEHIVLNKGEKYYCTDVSISGEKDPRAVVHYVKSIQDSMDQTGELSPTRWCLGSDGVLEGWSEGYGCLRLLEEDNEFGPVSP